MHGPVHADFANIPGMVDLVDQGAGVIGSFVWKIDNEAELREIISPLEFNQVFAHANSASRNRALRQAVSRYLIGGPRAMRERAALWVIKDWGGIEKGHDSIPEWLSQLKQFGDADVRRFVSVMKTDRIASWSKLLSFADYTKYPIYDARTATALNVLLFHTGNKLLFKFPPTQNTKIPKAIKDVHQALLRHWRMIKKRPRYSGYNPYCNLLHAVANRAGTDVLEVEMRLFANAVTLAANFVP